MTEDRSQLTRADLAGMTPDEIAAAHDAGRLAAALNGYTPDQSELIHRATASAVTLDDVRALAALGRHDLINDAHRSDRITFTTTTKEA